ncbi:MAG: hypothetical protein JWO38_6192 [Gemmataceae bacterium]|nr:hypothetical protein [Gemmataceae bacterium]
MTLLTSARPAVVLAAGLFLVLTGCGKAEPTKADDTKPADLKGTSLTPPPGPTPGEPVGTPPTPPTPPAPTGPVVLHPQDQAQEAATKFIADLRAAVEKPGPFPADLLTRLSPAFLKTIGKPTLSPDDKQRGYSTEAAGAWLQRAGGALAGIGLPTGYGSPTAAVFVGSFNNGGGRFLLRLVQADGAWKVDWFGLGTAKTTDGKAAATDGPFQEFAAQAFLDALTGGAQSREDRALLLGAILSPKAREVWAAPFSQDKEQGYEFSKSKLVELADKLGGGVGAYAVTPVGPDQFKVELTKGGMTTVRTLKLVKGPGPGEWQVDEFALPQ